MAKAKYIYFFGDGKADGHGQMKDLLGGKGAGLAEMSRSGVPVPQGFTVTTEVCRLYYKSGKKFPGVATAEFKAGVGRLEKMTGKKLGDQKKPLLVSVRSGAKFSMPGMMDTILNLGLNDETVKGLIKESGNPRWAYDCYRRFVQMFGATAMDFEKTDFEHILDEKKKALKAKTDADLPAEALQELVGRFKSFIKAKTGKPFPENPFTQLEMARDAVFRSWMNDRAIYYRKQNDIPHDIGTAVNVQSMVFGNTGNDSGTGVGFTRNPSTGEKIFYGEYLLNAQGEDVVAGIRTPVHIANLGKDLPEAAKQLKEITTKLEKHYRDIQDFEFTIEHKKLYMLQTRTGKRTAQAAVKIAVDMVGEKLITKQEAVMRVDPTQVEQLLHPVFDPKAQKKVIAKGLPASPGAATGMAVFTADAAAEWAKDGKATILVRPETTPDDIHGMDAAKGILTARGGMTSHAAVVARGMGKCCVAGCETIKVDVEGKTLDAGGVRVKEGEWISLDGSTGQVILGKVATIEATLSGEFGTFMKWADEFRKIGVRANADIPRDAKVARAYGAEGIGLCRTEHMFFAEDRLPNMVEMIMAHDEPARRKALAKLLPFQRADFKGLLKEMAPHPVTIRFLDPPLHEFLPKREELMVDVAVLEETDKDPEELKELKKVLNRVQELHEFNPMLGLRGCRLGILYPEITEMQTRAVFEAAVELAKEGVKTIPEIMIPLVGFPGELKHQAEIVHKVAAEVMKEKKTKIEYLVGTMIEVPRAAVQAEEIAKIADFFSFGTNDLTQTTLGFSRDDAGKIIATYIERGLFDKDPFATLDQAGVGALIKIGISGGRTTKPKLKIGICGEHGGDPASVKFCAHAGMNYVSCSPYRVPVARLAAAQAALGASAYTSK